MDANRFDARASAEATFEAMEARLSIVRRRLGRPLTLSEKILFGHLRDPESQALVPGESQLGLWPDRVILQDVLGQTAFLQLGLTGRSQVALPVSIVCDHLIVAKDDARPDLLRALDDNAEVYAFLKSAAARHGARFWEPGSGIIHQVILENEAIPGQIVLGTDSHTPNAGGVSACGVGVGGADAVEAMAGLGWEVTCPRKIGVVLEGALSGWTAPKDVVLWVTGQLGVSGGTNAVIEYIGAGARTLSATGRATICNLGAEMGATTSLFPADGKTGAYLAATGRAEVWDVALAHLALLAPDPEVEANPELYYDRVLRLDLGALEPQIAGPGSPDRVRPISVFVRDMRAAPDGAPALSAALIGSCTNSSYEDLGRAAAVARCAAEHGLTTQVPLFVTPGSERVRRTAVRDGQLAAIEAVCGDKGHVLASACGPCIGMWSRPAAGVNAIVTSYNRNFPGRNDGSPETSNFIASPEIVMAFALAGTLAFNPLTDTLPGKDGAPFRLAPPRAPALPEQGLSATKVPAVAPADSRVALAIDPKSERLQAMRPWPAWDGADFIDLPVLVKTRGKTTTDHISPAGPWLRYRGHLERFSENLLSGATNAFTGERGTTTNVFTGEAKQPVSQAARDYRSRGVRWAVVGDTNYGEGSSREHAALSPRLLGGAVVLARSFARIHETNLKKQGLLALTFSEVGDYDRVREGDRLTIRGLKDLTPGVAVMCEIRHADGTTETLELRHSYTASQLGWFRAGSALNAMGAA